MYSPYYAPYQRPMYYNPSIPNAQDMANFQQQYQQPQTAQPQMTAPPQTASDMIFVLNETEAMGYPVAPNTSVTLWDKNKDTVYIKANMQGVPSMRILDYTERTVDNGSKTAQNANCDVGGKFVCIDDFNALQSKFDGLQSELNELKAKKAKISKVVKMEEIDDE